MYSKIAVRQSLGCRKRRQHEATLLTSACRPTIAYSSVGTGPTPSAVPSSSNFPASHFPRRSNVGFAPILGIVVNVRDLRAHPCFSECRLLRAFLAKSTFRSSILDKRVPSCGKRSREPSGFIRRPICLGRPVMPLPPSKQAAAALVRGLRGESPGTNCHKYRRRYRSKWDESSCRTMLSASLFLAKRVNIIRRFFIRLFS